MITPESLNLFIGHSELAEAARQLVITNATFASPQIPAPTVADGLPPGPAINSKAGLLLTLAAESAEATLDPTGVSQDPADQFPATVLNLEKAVSLYSKSAEEGDALPDVSPLPAPAMSTAAPQPHLSRSVLEQIILGTHFASPLGLRSEHSDGDGRSFTRGSSILILEPSKSRALRQGGFYWAVTVLSALTLVAYLIF